MTQRRSYESALSAMLPSVFEGVVSAMGARSDIPGEAAPPRSRAVALTLWAAARKRLWDLQEAMYRANPGYSGADFFVETPEPPAEKTWALTADVRSVRVVTYNDLAKAYVEFVGPSTLLRPGERVFIAAETLLALGEQIRPEETDDLARLRAGMAPVRLMLLVLARADRTPWANYLVTP